MDETRVRTALNQIATTKPRHYLGILTALEKLVRLEINKYTLVVESAVPLGANLLRDVQNRLQARFGTPLATRPRVNPALVGGLRIQMGSNVWDGSIVARLNALKTQN